MPFGDGGLRAHGARLLQEQDEQWSAAKALSSSPLRRASMAAKSRADLEPRTDRWARVAENRKNMVSPAFLRSLDFWESERRNSQEDGLALMRIAVIRQAAQAWWDQAKSISAEKV
ncbi:MAG: hypothetical protein HKL90_02765 [Elusimicrobia bacterium]|nr:hypothetical protein [Elusimicrobiota bacterium]